MGGHGGRRVKEKRRVTVRVKEVEGVGGSMKTEVVATAIYAGYGCKILDVNDQLSRLNMPVGYDDTSTGT